MKKNIGIVGSGIVGLLVGYKFQKKGHRVTIYEKDTKLNLRNCSITGAGMLSPFCELIHSDKKIFDLGFDSILRWKEIIKDLNKKIFFKTKGSLIISHKEEVADLESICSRINSYSKSNFSLISNSKLRKLEPAIDSTDLNGVFFKEEGQIDSEQIIDSLSRYLTENNSIINYGCEVKQIKNNTLTLKDNEKKSFDHIIECTGLGSQRSKSDIRGVRGEIIKVFAPGVKISRPIRLNHFRYPIYIAPREKDTYLIGATEIESEDFSPVSVRSAIELLNSSIFICKRFSEARIISLSSNCRPAYSDNLPHLKGKNGHISVNGLFRHGYLLSPLIADLVIDLCLKDKKDKNLSYIYN